MSHLLIVKRLELYMYIDLALYKINILLLLLRNEYQVGFREDTLQRNHVSHPCHIGYNRPAIVREIPHFGLFTVFPHFCENVPHFWLYFVIRKIVENRINFRWTEKFCSKEVCENGNDSVT